MAVPIDEAMVRRIARLSRLELSEPEARLFASQLHNVLAYVEQIGGVDTTDVPPLAHALTVTNVLRDDEPRGGLSSVQALSNAPDREGEFFRVPAVLDDGGVA